MVNQALSRMPAALHALPPQVAGRFYTADPVRLAQEVDDLLAGARPSSISRAAKAFIVPHAGNVFSGPVAATAYAGLKDRPITTVIMLAPCHRARLNGIALPSADAMATPLGAVPIAWDAARKVVDLPHVTISDSPFAGEHALEVHLPFLQRLLPKAAIVPLLVGDAEPDAVAQLLDRLWGGPETVLMFSSDLSHYLPDSQARPLDRRTVARIEALQPGALDGQQACGHRVIKGALLAAQARDLRVTALDVRTSADTAGSADKVVGYASLGFEYAHSARLSDEARRLLLATAAEALRGAVTAASMLERIDVTGRLPLGLASPRATFVTLERADGSLRGCIGSLVPHRSLIADVAFNAVKAGLSDKRFAPLTLEELADLSMSISVLSHPRPIAAANADALLANLRPDVDGLIVADAGKSALFLPSVWRSIPDPRAFLAQLLRKAGLPANHWSPTLSAKRFGVEYWRAPLKECSPPDPRIALHFGNHSESLAKPT
jgi:MEMO1 family protein